MGFLLEFAPSTSAFPLSSLGRDMQVRIYRVQVCSSRRDGGYFETEKVTLPRWDLKTGDGACLPSLDCSRSEISSLYHRHEMSPERDWCMR